MTTGDDRAARGVLDRAISERELQDTVIAMAKAQGFLCYHVFDSRRSEYGFPDLVLVYAGNERRHYPIIFAELKREGKNPTTAQQRWIDAIRDTIGFATDYVIAEVWRPSDLPRIQALLEGTAA